MATTDEDFIDQLRQIQDGNKYLYTSIRPDSLCEIVAIYPDHEMVTITNSDGERKDESFYRIKEHYYINDTLALQLTLHQYQKDCYV